MFRPDASLVLRIARSVLVPFGPLVAAIALANARMVSESAGGFLILVSLGWFFCSLILIPALLFRADGGSGPSSDGGGSGGPQDPPSRDPDPGGIPLPDAEQSRERVRDHVRGRRAWPHRRTARDPTRMPAR